MSNSGPAVRLCSEGRATARPEDCYRKGRNQIPNYLVAIHHPDDFDPSTETEATMRDIDALNEEMMAAGVRIFAGGLTPVREAKSLRAQPDGKVLATDGPYLETKEHIGGFWVLEAADLDEALAWGRKAVVACRAPVEVRPFGIPD
ncbi:MAG: YciI family protein [Candidatus Acidiferrales bacterium]